MNAEDDDDDDRNSGKEDDTNEEIIVLLLQIARIAEPDQSSRDNQRIEFTWLDCLHVGRPLAYDPATLLLEESVFPLVEISGGVVVNVLHDAKGSAVDNVHVVLSEVDRCRDYLLDFDTVQRSAAGNDHRDSGLALQLIDKFRLLCLLRILLLLLCFLLVLLLRCCAGQPQLSIVILLQFLALIDNVFFGLPCISFDSTPTEFSCDEEEC